MNATLDPETPTPTDPATAPESAPDAPVADARPPGYALRWLVLAVVLAGNIMDLLDATIVNIAGPSIRADLGGGGATLQWLSAGYTLTFAILLITSARLGDIIGRRQLFLIGSAGFTLTSAACAAAPSPGVLIGLRALQGAFGALLIPQGFGLLKESFPDEEMGKVFAVFGPAMGLPMLAAPVLAGALIGANLWGTGWRLVFLINVPVGILALALGIRALPKVVSHPDRGLDLPGMALVGLALTAIIYPLIEGREHGWPAWAFGLLAVGVGLLGAFALYQRRKRVDPLIDPALFSNRTYLSGLAVLLTSFGAFGGLLLCVSLFTQLGEGFTPIHAGLTLTPMVVGMILGMMGSFALVEKLGRHLISGGIALVACGTTALALTISGAHSASTWDLAPSLFVAGLGAGTYFGQLFDFILAGVDMKNVGSASGVLEAVQQLSTALGVAVLGTIFFSGLHGHLPTHPLAIVAWACLVPLAAAFLLAFLLPMQARPEGAGH